MRFLRKRLIVRILSISFLILFLQSVFLPNYSYALTSGPHMPEYTAYESPGATDMVNLNTGDFSFSLPVLEVPGPEGNFSLPLAYNAGIGLDQEASWVGLGWSMNPGAITRNIVGFPDDANGEIQNVTVQDLVGLRGWNATAMGVGSMGWSNQNGHFGSVSVLGIINAGWDDNSWYGGIIGINASDNGLYVDPLQFMVGIMTIASWGAAGAAAQGGSFAAGVMKQVAIDAAMSVASSQLSYAMNGNGSVNSPTNGHWSYSKNESTPKHKSGLLAAGSSPGSALATSLIFKLKEYKIWLDQTRYEEMYGTLYLGNAPTDAFSNSQSLTHARIALTSSSGTVNEPLYNFRKTVGKSNQGAASDISYKPDPYQSFKDVNNPTFLATDNFSVKIGGVGGSIMPYRLEVGSVSMPREMSSNHTRLAPVKYLTNDATYKVPFVYRGQVSNSYFHHVGGATAVTDPNFYFGVNWSTTVNAGFPKTLKFDLNDVALKSQRIKSGIPTSKKIPQGNFVEWLSNDEIRNGITYPSKFIDFLSGGSSVSSASDRFKFRTPVVRSTYTSYTSNFISSAIPVDGSAIPLMTPPSTINLTVSFYDNATNYSNGVVLGVVNISNVSVVSVSTSTFAIPSDTECEQYAGKIADIQVQLVPNETTPIGFGGLKSLGGFSITGVDGTSYHFALPINDYDITSEVHEIAHPNTKRSIIKRSEPFANTWVITAITGSDFIDKNQNGLVDEGDWGYWVKFNYGLHANDYIWRLPYSGFRKETDNVHESYSQGKKQLIYLNSIETRSHVALFLKGNRLDGRSAPDNVIYPLNLEEIALVTRENYKKMIANYGVPQFSDQLVNTCLSSHFNSARTFLNSNCIKRIIFTYDYTLCPGTLNSASGKLTLKQLSIKGRNDVKLVPDYKFEYGNNPSYNANYWDGWGMYHNNGSASSTDHRPSETNGDTEGAAWSLSKIINPLGSEILINYERDRYSTVSSGAWPVETTVNYNNNGSAYYCPDDFPMTVLDVNHNNALKPGDKVRIDGAAAYSCSSGGNNYSGSHSIYKDGLTITSVTANSITVDQSFLDACDCVPDPQNWSGNINFSSFYGSVFKYYDYKKGDGLRVASLVTKDELGNQNKIRYLYTDPDGIRSSGVVAQEPEYIGLPSNIPGFPHTPVIYGQVAVLNGKLTTDNDYYSKHVYEFETPSSWHYTITPNQIELQNNFAVFSGTYYDYITIFENKIEDRTAKIGSLKSIKVYDKYDALKSSSALTYTETLKNDGVNKYHGIYSSGVIMLDLIGSDQSTNRYHKLNRSTVLQYPWVVQKITNSSDGITSESQNVSWDFLTGMVDQRLDKSSLGLNLKTVKKPAYSFTTFAELGSRAENITNRNMLSQNASTYIYRVDAAGNPIGLVSASLQAWKKDWTNYRYHNGTSYVQTPEETISSANKVWRKGAAYTWKGSFARKLADGSQSFAPNEVHNFSAPPTSDWLYMGEYTQFDHFGMPLESKDLKQIFSATKMGYDNRTVLASASNATYSEIAFSSAEDEIPVIGYFGGEVAVRSSGGNATVVKKSAGGDAHTGDRALSLSTGYGFVYKPSTLTTNRVYITSVWTNSTNGRLYYKLNGSTEVLSTAPVSQGKPGWYRINMEITVGTTFSSLEVGVKSNSGTVLFDDFRFQPADAVMICNVFVPLDYEYLPGQSANSWMLDNDNLYTRYETSESGLINKVYAETIKFATGPHGGEKLISQSKSDYRRFHISQ